MSLANRQLTCACCGELLPVDESLTDFELIIDEITRMIAVRKGHSVYHGKKEVDHGPG